MIKFRDQYLGKANYLMEQDPEESDSTNIEPTDKIEIYFDNLDEESQKNIMMALRNSLNVVEDDKYGNDKIIETLSKKPMFTVIADELVRLMNIDI
ncbi:MAG: hypothetical protein PHF86_11805 [Candidatus Nanoarchaeia archaeon]|jgi:hypothetical protein|nr:hypothetical protein [Candidatus Nanoarchaeia archaeon]